MITECVTPDYFCQSRAVQLGELAALKVVC